MKVTKRIRPLRKKVQAKTKKSKAVQGPVRPVGMHFKTRDAWTACLSILDALGKRFDIAGDKTIVVDQEVADRLAGEGFQFERLQVIHMLDLPLEKQKQIRAGLPKEEVLKRMRQRVREGFAQRD